MEKSVLIHVADQIHGALAKPTRQVLWAGDKLLSLDEASSDKVSRLLIGPN